MREQAFLLLVCSGICLAAIPVLIYVWYRNRKFKAEAVPAKGVVIGLHNRPGKSGTLYSPIVRFSVTSGEPVEFTDRVGSRPPLFEVGDQVDVLYNQHKPTWAHVVGDSPASVMFAVLTNGCVTLVLIVICLVMAAGGAIAYFIRTMR